MFDHVLAFLNEHSLELVGLGVAAAVASVMRAYGRHLERRTREASERQPIH